MTNLPPERPFPWALLILGLLIGVIGGLYYAWFLNPVSFEDVPPSELNTVDRERYVLLISEAYLQDGDLTRARERLAALGVSDPAAFVAAQADDAFLSGAEPDMIRALASLAEALGAQPQAAEVFSGTVPPTTIATPTVLLTPTPQQTPPTPTITPTATLFIPTLTPTPPRAQAFNLVERDDLCIVGGPGRIEVTVLDESGAGVPGVPVLVTWDPNNEDRFFTGLQPDAGLGFADFTTQPDQLYTVRLVGLSDPVVGLSSFACTTDDGAIGETVFRLLFTPLVDTPEPGPTEEDDPPGEG